MSVKNSAEDEYVLSTEYQKLISKRHDTHVRVRGLAFGE